MESDEELKSSIASVNKAADGALYSVPQDLGRGVTGLQIAITKNGVINAGWLEVKVGCDRFNLFPIDDRENWRIPLTSSATKFLRCSNLVNDGRYVQATVVGFSGTGNADIRIDKIGLRS